MRSPANDIFLPDLPKQVVFQPCAELSGIRPAELCSLTLSFDNHDVSDSKLSRNALDCVLTSTCVWRDVARSSEAITLSAYGCNPSSGSSTTIR